MSSYLSVKWFIPFSSIQGSISLIMRISSFVGSSDRTALSVSSEIFNVFDFYFRKINNIFLFLTHKSFLYRKLFTIVSNKDEKRDTVEPQ